MIQDHELNQLSNVESEVVGSLGFTGLGAAVGLFGPFLTAVIKIQTPSRKALGIDEVFYLVGFSGMVVLGVVCLVIHGISTWRRKGLAAVIRERPKLGMKHTE